MFHAIPTGAVEEFDLVSLFHQCIGRIFAYISIHFADPRCLFTVAVSRVFIIQGKCTLITAERCTTFTAGIDQCM